MKKGFTLIELLVVIAIIGILSSIVLASLNTARSKGANAAIQQDLDNIRSQAELVYDTNSPNGYTGTYNVCADANVVKGITSAATVAGGSVGTVNAANTSPNATCYQSLSTWVVQATLKVPDSSGNAYWCVDNSGTEKSENTLTAANATVCP